MTWRLRSTTLPSWRLWRVSSFGRAIPILGLPFSSHRLVERKYLLGCIVPRGDNRVVQSLFSRSNNVLRTLSADFTRDWYGHSSKPDSECQGFHWCFNVGIVSSW